jgi:hypothetical protein
MYKHRHVTIYETLVAGIGKNRRIPLGISAGYAAYIKRIWFDVTGSSMIQGVSTNPENKGLISNDAVKKQNDILVYSADDDWRYWDLGDLPVLRDLMFMADITFGGTLDYGVHVIYELRKISELEECNLMVKELP